MPWYDGNLPTEFQDAVEMRSGARFAAEVIYDPSGENVTFEGKYSVVSISPISMIKDLDINGSVVPTIGAVTIKFNDPDEYFSPDNSNSFLYGIDPIGKELVINLLNLTETTIKKIPIFAGRIDRLPVLELGFSSFICSDRRKFILNQKIKTPDTSSAKKLMVVGSSGGLVDSVTYEDNWNRPPFEFEISDGALPTGLTLSAAGAITGTPTDTGDFFFTVICRNAEGLEKELDCSLTVITTPVNYHFTSAGGLGDFTEVKNKAGAAFSLASRESYCRCTLNGVYDWDTDSNEAPHLIYNSATGLSGNWVLIGRVDHAGLSGANATYTGIYVRRGEFKGNVLAVEYRTTGATYAASLYRADDNSNRARANIAQSYAWVKIVKTGTTYDFYYRTAESGAWTLLKTDTQTETPTEVGFMVMNDLTGNGYGEIDQILFYPGALAIDTNSALPTAAVNLAYSITIEASGGSGEYSYSVSSGVLPTGLSLAAATGIISGTPTVAKSLNFDITVTDGAGSTAVQSFNLTVEDELFFYPSKFTDGQDDVAYDQSFTVYGDGVLDRTEITVGATCGLGKWELEFTDQENYKVNGPGVKDKLGNITDEFSEGGVTIPMTAWSGHFSEGNIIYFVTGKNYENQNAVKTIYDLYIASGVAAKYLDASSYFGDVELGTLWGGASNGATAIKVKTPVPILIKAGETLLIEEGANSDEVEVATGNDVPGGFPPYVELTVAALANDYSEQATVTWLERMAIDEDFTFDEFYDYCDDNVFNPSLTFEREMTYLQAIELVCQHAGIYTAQGIGKERAAGAILRAAEVVHELDSSEILARSVVVEHLEPVTTIEVEYGYNYINQEFLSSYSSTSGSGGQTKSLSLCGYYGEGQISALVAVLFQVYDEGLKLVDCKLDLKGLICCIGERIDIDSVHPDFTASLETFGHVYDFASQSATLKNFKRDHINGD